MCFSNPFIAVVLFNAFSTYMEDWGKQEKMARTVILRWPDLIGNVIPISVFTNSNLISIEHTNSNSTQVLINWVSCPAKQSRFLSRGGGGVLPEKLGRGMRSTSQNPSPIYDLTKNLIPYL